MSFTTAHLEAALRNAPKSAPAQEHERRREALRSLVPPPPWIMRGDNALYALGVIVLAAILLMWFCTGVFAQVSNQTMYAGATLPITDRCKSLPALGAPTMTSGLNLTEVCHAGYDAMVDDDARVPRWVAYELTGPHTMGCSVRKNNFHADPALPSGSARPTDYDKSGYDKGHQAPAEDFAWSADQESDSFSMANMAPQVPGLNRQMWERLEETVRAWAYERGALAVYVGPDLTDSSKRIGKHGVLVPVAFWKVVVDEDTREALAFYMANKTIAKGDVAPYQVPVEGVAAKVGVSLPVPNQTAEQIMRSAVWPVDLPAWRRAHAARCKR